MVAPSVGSSCHRPKVNEGEKKKRKGEKEMDIRAARDDKFPPSCLALVVEREAMDERP
jgi:hypothetical protein